MISPLINGYNFYSAPTESKKGEIVHPKKNNIIIECLYRLPFLMCDFNVALMKTDTDFNTSQIFDTMTSNLIVPRIIYPTRITPHSKTLINDIFSNSLNYSQGHSGNLSLSISDHPAQFLISSMDYNFIPKNNNIYTRDTKNFDREHFTSELRNIDHSTIDIGKEDPNYSINSYEVAVSTLIDKYMPLKKLTKKEKKQQYKPWITNVIRKSIKRNL